MFRREDGSIIRTEDNGEISICSSCQDEVIQDGLRYVIDIMIVPVSEDSLEAVIQHEKYICPSRYIGRRPRRRLKFIAFYKGGSIGAITHIARVVNVTFNVSSPGVSAFLKTPKQSIWMNENEFAVYDLQKIIPLKYKIVKNDSSAIQNRSYKTFKQFAKARKLEDLYIQMQKASEKRL